MKYRKIRAIISGGGTGGHIFPALSIANKLKELGIDQHLIIFPESGHELGRDPECTDSLQRVILDYCEKYFD